MVLLGEQMKKFYRVEINVTSTAWESVEAYVEADSEEEARKLFENDPWDYDWDNWETHDSTIRDWEIESVEYDKWLTDRENAKVQSND